MYKEHPRSLREFHSASKIRNWLSWTYATDLNWILCLQAPVHFFLLLLGWSCKNINLIISFSLLHASTSPGEKPKSLMRHCKFPQYQASPHFYPHLLTLRASTSSSGASLWTCLALDLHAVVHVSPSLECSTFSACACQNHTHVRGSAQIPLPIYIYFNLVKSLCLLLHLSEWLHPPWHRLCLDEPGEKAHVEGNEDVGMM